MRSLPISLVMGTIAVITTCESTGHSQDYYAGDVYYTSPRVVYYRSYTPMYYAPPVYYSVPYYSYDPQYVYYAAPLYCEPSTIYESPDRSDYVTRRAESPKPTTTVTVGAYDNRFEPQTINVQLGSTVHWVNYGQHAHTVTANDDSWDSGDIKPGASYSATFMRPGRYDYYCRHHKADGMQGVIVVASSAGAEHRGMPSPGY